MWTRGAYFFLAGHLRAFLALAFALGLFPAEATADAPKPYIDAQQEVAPPLGFEGVCQRYIWACARAGGAGPAGRDALVIAEQVNLNINRQTREIADDVQYRTEEYWALPTEVGGDCEDFALAKKRALIQRGIAPERLLIATVLDRSRKPHAVLIFRTDGGDLVLDNLTDRILGWHQTGYTYLRMQNPLAPHRWTAVLSGGILGG